MRGLAVIIFSLLVFFSCDKDEDYSSILGEWLVEEWGEVSEYHKYYVSIQRMHTDTSLYKISNFYRTGTANELIVELNGLELEISPQPVGNYYIQGVGLGTVQSDFKKISLKYQVTGNAMNEEVEAIYTRK